MFKLDPLSFTKLIFFFLKLCFSKSSIKFLAKVFAKIFAISKKPNVTCFGYQSIHKNLITRANMLCIPFDIKISKLNVTKLHFAKTSQTYNYLVFPTILGNIFFEICFLERKIRLRHKCKHRHFIHRL
jgi:hypothetical protein